MSVKDVAELLAPPETKTSHVKAWRFWMSIGIMGLYAHMLWACGLLPGLQGFAMAGEVAEVKKAQYANYREVLETRIFDMRIKQCTALKELQPSKVVQTYAEQVDSLRKKYRDLTGSAYELTACNEL